MRPLIRQVLAVFIVGMLCCNAPASPPPVNAIRVPEGGVQPQVGVDGARIVHLIYLTGEAQASDVRYARTTAGRVTLGDPVPVNTHPRSAVATGTVRGA